MIGREDEAPTPFLPSFHPWWVDGRKKDTFYSRSLPRGPETVPQLLGRERERKKLARLELPAR
jgi:hypothetical protein